MNCECGCGKTVRAGRRFVQGHNENQRKAVEYLEEDHGLPSLCWIHQNVPQPTGYVQIRRKGRNVVAHRHFYEEVFGAVPEGFVLDHLCRNRACCNPSHLEVVTQTENLRRGNSTKLSMEEVRDIRYGPYGKRGSERSPKSLAKKYGVTAATVGRIRAGRGWADV